jgi:choline dehydrogenase-like flavoprotein
VTPGAFLSAPAVNGKTYDIAVVGAGAFGGWTAYWARKLGASVVLIDAYGRNSRSTSGDETRGVRSSYGDRPKGEQWMQWATVQSNGGKPGTVGTRPQDAPLVTTGDLLPPAGELHEDHATCS